MRPLFTKCLQTLCLCSFVLVLLRRGIHEFRQQGGPSAGREGNCHRGFAPHYGQVEGLGPEPSACHLIVLGVKIFTGCGYAIFVLFCGQLDSGVRRSWWGAPAQRKGPRARARGASRPSAACARKRERAGAGAKPSTSSSASTNRVGFLFSMQRCSLS